MRYNTLAIFAPAYADIWTSLNDFVNSTPFNVITTIIGAILYKLWKNVKANKQEISLLNSKLTSDLTYKVQFEFLSAQYDQLVKTSEATEKRLRGLLASTAKELNETRSKLESKKQ